MEPAISFPSNSVDFLKENNGLNELNPKENTAVSLLENPPNEDLRDIDPLTNAKRTTDLFKWRFIRLGLLTATALQIMKVGGFLFEHGVAFYAYVQYAPKTLWGQYFYANATHEAAKKILSAALFGCSISSVMTSVLAVIGGVIISKGGAAIYNVCVDSDKKISITLTDMISDIFSFVFRGTLF